MRPVTRRGAFLREPLLHFLLLGIGRMYMGQVTFGVLQLVGCLVFAVVTCGIGYVVPVVWGIVDAVVLMTGTPRDQYGRLLRDGG